MELLKTCGPPPPTAVYTNLPTVIELIQAHAKANGYALFKCNTSKNQIVYASDRYGKPQAKPKKEEVHKSKRHKGSRSKKCNCKVKVT